MNMKQRNSIYYLAVLSLSMFFFSVMPIKAANVGEKTPELVYVDHDYVNIEVSPTKDNDYKISAESKNGGAADWLVYVIKLKDDELKTAKDFQIRAKDNNRAKYVSEAEVVDVIYVPSKSYARYLDVIDIVAEVISDAVFDSKDTATITRDNSIYLIRAYSGAWSVAGDKAERKFVGDEVDSGKKRLESAVMTNLLSAAFDGASLVVPMSKLLDDPIAKKKIIESSRKGVAEALPILYAKSEGKPPDIEDFLMMMNKVTNSVISDLADYMVEEGAEEAQKTLLKKCSSFLAKSADVAIDVAKGLNVASKVSKFGQLADRSYAMVLTATPLETSYVVNKNFEQAEENSSQSAEGKEVSEAGVGTDKQPGGGGGGGAGGAGPVDEQSLDSQSQDQTGTSAFGGVDLKKLSASELNLLAEKSPATMLARLKGESKETIEYISASSGHGSTVLRTLANAGYFL